MPDVNPEPRAVDEEVDRSIRREPTKPNGTERLEAPRQSRVVGDREIDLEELCQATEKALGLAKRKMEDHADRQRSFDREVGIGALAAGFAAGRPRAQTNFVPDTETSHACTGFASDTSSALTSGRGRSFPIR